MLKQGSRTHSVLRQSSSQLQKYKAAHSKSAVKHTQRYDGAVHKFKKMAARTSGRIAVDQKVCGGDGGHPGLRV